MAQCSHELQKQAGWIQTHAIRLESPRASVFHNHSRIVVQYFSATCEYSETQFLPEGQTHLPCHSSGSSLAACVNGLLCENRMV